MPDKRRKYKNPPARRAGGKDILNAVFFQQSLFNSQDIRKNHLMALSLQSRYLFSLFCDFIFQRTVNPHWKICPFLYV